MQHMILMSKKMTSQNKLYEIESVPYNKPLSRQWAGLKPLNRASSPINQTHCSGTFGLLVALGGHCWWRRPW